MIVSLIAILTVNHVIGRKNIIPWYFPQDMSWFKYHTIGKPVIMGRKTFESIKKPLLNRLNIILSKSLLSNQWLVNNNNIIIVNTPEQALLMVEKSKEVMVIGGSEIYNIFLPRSTRMYLTYIDYIYQYGDSWFPQYTEREWKLIVSIHKLHKMNKKNYYNLYFKIFNRY